MLVTYIVKIFKTVIVYKNYLNSVESTFNEGIKKCIRIMNRFTYESNFKNPKFIEYL